MLHHWLNKIILCLQKFLWLFSLAFKEHSQKFSPFLTTMSIALLSYTWSFMNMPDSDIENSSNEKPLTSPNKLTTNKCCCWDCIPLNSPLLVFFSAFHRLLQTYCLLDFPQNLSEVEHLLSFSISSCENLYCYELLFF